MYLDELAELVGKLIEEHGGDTPVFFLDQELGGLISVKTVTPKETEEGIVAVIDGP